VSAEVEGRVLQISADAGEHVQAGQLLAQLDTHDVVLKQDAARAEANRTKALLVNQQRVVHRFREMNGQKFVSQTQLQDAEAQLAALREQLKGAEALLAQTERALTKTRIVAPVSGRIEERKVSPGDFVSVGKPLFQIATTERLRVRLPFPETVADKIKPGLAVTLITPTAPDKIMPGRVKEIRPMIGTGSRSFDAIVEVENPGDWKPGASVNAVVVVEKHAQAVMVPELAVVLRPAGKVVYVIENNKALQRIVQTGVRQDGFVEIVAGVAAGESVALDGAGFLTDQAHVNVQTAP
ncbi:MAG: efflux RND transporter periplasmic adaptor subunit, partial [Gammaproteobacteria bacterium]